MILSICDDPKILEIMRIVNIAINIIRIVVPIILIFVLMIKLMGAVTKSDEDGLQKVMKTAPKNILAAALVFLVPFFVRMVVKITAPDSEYEKCISITSLEEIEEIYEQNMEELVSRAEETKTSSDYATAYDYLKYVKDEDKRQEYEERLEKVRSEIDSEQEPITPEVSHDYSKVNYSNFKWTYYTANTGPIKKYTSQTVHSYAIWAPSNVSDLNGVSLPVIIWLHGAGEMGGGTEKDRSKLLGSGLLNVMSNWSKYNLAPVPAIIVAPQSPTLWGTTLNYDTIKALISYVEDVYHTDSSKRVLMGHSIGGRGVVRIAYEHQDLNLYAVIPLSGWNLRYDNDNKIIIIKEEGKEYFSRIKIRGYGEYPQPKKDFFEWIGKPNEYVYYSEWYDPVNRKYHGRVPERAMTDDLNHDGVSDMMYWLFGDDAKTNSSRE